MSWTYANPDARNALRVHGKFLGAIRSLASPSQEELETTRAIYDALVHDAIDHAAGPIFVSLADVSGVIHLRVEDLGPSRAMSPQVGATVLARDLIGNCVDVALTFLRPIGSDSPISKTDAAQVLFERWELARWIDANASSLAERVVQDAAPLLTSIFGAHASAAAPHLAVSFRHLGNAIALDEAELFLSEVRWLLATGTSHAIDSHAMLELTIRSVESLRDGAPLAHARAFAPLLAGLKALVPAPAAESHLGNVLAERYFSAFSSEEQSVDAFFKEVLDLGVSRRAVFLDMLQQAQRETGRRWQLGELSVLEEQRRTAVAMRLMATLRAKSPVLARHGLLFGATAPGEEHHIGLQMVCDLAAIDGWEIVMSTPGLETVALIEAIEAAHPDVIALSATMSAHVAGLIGVIAEIRSRPSLSRCAIVVGGAPFTAFPHLCEIVDADAFALDAADAVEVLRTYSRGARLLLASLRHHDTEIER